MNREGDDSFGLFACPLVLFRDFAEEDAVLEIFEDELNGN